MRNVAATTSTPLSEWLGRILGLAVASVPILFVSDAFGQGDRSVVVTLLVHVGMALPLVVALAVAWSRPRIGAAAYLVLGILYALRLLTRAGPTEGLIFALPLFLIAALFWSSSTSKDEE